MSEARRRIIRERERGATALVLALVMLILMAGAALGMDIAKLAYERQALRAAVDAAAQAGSYALPDATTAVSDAKTFLVNSAPDLKLDKTKLDVKLYCAVAVKTGTTNSPDENQVPGICNPGTAWVKGQAATACNGQICLLPCGGSGAACNTIKVSYQKVVNFVFAPAIGIPTGTTGAVSSASCKGMCGALAPNPLDIVVMADRTPSMNNGTSAFANMKQSLKDMLLTMNRDQQLVAFGTIAKSVPTSACLSAEPTNASGSSYPNAFAENPTTIATTKSKVPQTNKLWTFNGSWVPVGYSYNYTTGSPTTNNLAVNTASDIYKAINCLDYSDSKVDYPAASSGYKVSTNEGTHLAAALKGATRYILNTPSSGAGLPDRSMYGTPKKVIIFETDGAPSELFNSASSAISLGDSHDIGYTGGSDVGNGLAQSCKNLLDIATLAKAQGIKIITIGVGDVNTATCGTQGNVRDVLAKVASPKASGANSDAVNCTISGNTALENSDGDNYFCAASAGDLSSIFAAAVASITGNTKFIKVPGVSD